MFGNSGGASIALKLTEDHPQQVRGLIVHEPPIMGILADADLQMQFLDTVHATCRSQGVGPAMRQFAMSLVGFSPIANAPGDQGGNMDRFMALEYLPIGRYLPDLAKIKRDGVPAIACAGTDSLDAYTRVPPGCWQRRLPVRMWKLRVTT